jgi:hypothetical protein
MMKYPEFDQMVAVAERLRLELDSSDRKNLVGSQIIPDKSRYRTNAVLELRLSGKRVKQTPATVLVANLR